MSHFESSGALNHSAAASTEVLARRRSAQNASARTLKDRWNDASKKILRRTEGAEIHEAFGALSWRHSLGVSCQQSWRASKATRKKRVTPPEMSRRLLLLLLTDFGLSWFELSLKANSQAAQTERISNKCPPRVNSWILYWREEIGRSSTVPSHFFNHSFKHTDRRGGFLQDIFSCSCCTRHADDAIWIDTKSLIWA